MNELTVGDYYKSIWGDKGEWGIIRYNRLQTGVKNNNYNHSNYVYLSHNKKIIKDGSGGYEMNEWNSCTEEEIELFEKQFKEQYKNKECGSIKSELLIFN